MRRVVATHVSPPPFAFIPFRYSSREWRWQLPTRVEDDAIALYILDEGGIPFLHGARREHDLHFARRIIVADVGEAKRMGKRFSHTVIYVWIIAIKNCQQIDIARIMDIERTFFVSGNRTK